MKNYLKIFLALSFFGCNKAAIGPLTLKQEFNIKKNETIKVKDGINEISLKITEINDSRCPADVVCIRAGEAIVKFDLEFTGFPLKAIQLCRDCDANLPIPNSIAVTNGKEKYIIGLISVNPYPKSANIKDEKVLRMVVE
jgi:hypothetical protein